MAGAGAYAELRLFALEHRKCAGRRRADTSLATPSGYSVLVRCGCGRELTHWVTPEDPHQASLRSALLAFEN
jgi:hypothetical protein